MKKRLSFTLALIMVLSLGTCSFASGSTPSATNAVRVEAEAAQLSGSAQLDEGDTASKGKFVSYIDNVGNSVTFKNAPQAKSLTIGYSRGDSDAGKLSLYLNDVKAKEITFPGTDDWYGFKTKNVNVDIPAGANVKFQFDDGSNAINLDYVDFNASTVDETATVKQAEPTPTTQPATTETAPVAKPTPKPAAKPVVKPAAKPVKITAAMRASAKNLATQVKKLAVARGNGLTGMIGKSGMILGQGYNEDGLNYTEIKFATSMLGKDAKGNATIKMNYDLIDLSQNLALLKNIKTSPKLQELALNTNIDNISEFKKLNYRNPFLGAMFQPNGTIIIGGFDRGGVWLFFKKEGTQYKLYKMMNIQ